MLRRTPLLELPGVVADLGYEHIELSPRSDFMPFFVHPRANRQMISDFRRELDAAGVEIACVLPLYRWAGPDEDARQAAVRYWKRAIEVTVELGAQVMNTEFNGRPEAQPESEAQFLALPRGAPADLRARGDPPAPRAASRRLHRGRLRGG